ncbi:MAG: site-specific integrase [Kiritimatiellae bacterium]|nr:site-specific integrase [Kiritimatiellia bacterium]
MDESDDAIVYDIPDPRVERAKADFIRHEKIRAASHEALEAAGLERAPLRGKRSKGMGTLERRGSVWVARWQVRGVRYSRSTGTARRDLAEEKLLEWTAPFRIRNELERLSMWQGKIDGVRRECRRLEDLQPAMRIEEAYKAYLMHPECTVSATSKRSEFSQVRYGFFVAFMRRRHPAVRELREVTPEHAKDFLENGLARKSGATRNDVLCLMRRIWRTLADSPYARLVANPWEKIKRVPVLSVRRRELSADELVRIFQMADGEMRFLFLVGIYTGLRLGDCALLEWANVNLMRGFISVVPRKTAKKTGMRVLIPIHGVLREALRELRKRNTANSQYVLPEIANLYTTHLGRLSFAIHQVFRACGIDTDIPAPDSGRRRSVVGFHSLRHTFVSLSANAGAPLAVVQSLVGHANIDMTRHYFHESLPALKGAVAAIPDITGAAAADSSVPPQYVMDIVEKIENLSSAAELRFLRRHISRLLKHRMVPVIA